jgi:predicted DNA-binding transcriptional regulator AlpA
VSVTKTKSRSRKAAAPTSARQARQFCAAPMPRVEPPPPTRRLLSRKEVCEMTGISYPTIWQHMRRGTFPQSRAVGGRSFWLSDEVAAWIEALPNRQLKPLDESEAVA